MFEPVAVARRRVGLGPRRGERLFARAQVLPGRFGGARVDPAIAVEQGAMAARIEQAAIVMLAVNLDEQGAELALEAGGDRLVVDKGAAAAVRLDDAADEQGLAGRPGEAVLVEQGARGMVGCDLEADADHCLPLPGADQGAVGPHAEREPQGIEQDRLPRPRLPGQHAEPPPEFEIERFDQHDVADREAGQHGESRARHRRPSLRHSRESGKASSPRKSSC